MKYRIGNALEWIANLFHALADRAYRYGEPEEDIGEGWWSMDQSFPPFPLQKYESHITFTDVPAHLWPGITVDEALANIQRMQEFLNRSDNPVA